MAISPVVSTPAMTMPMTGVPLAERRAKAAGNRPSRAAAIGTWPTTKVQPFRAPKQEMAAPSATSSAARLPKSTRAASANGAVDWPSDDGSSSPITPTVLPM